MTDNVVRNKIPTYSINAREKDGEISYAVKLNLNGTTFVALGFETQDEAEKTMLKLRGIMPMLQRVQMP